MTVSKTLALSVLLWGLSGLSATAAPMSSTGGSWSWWSPVYSSPATSGWTSNQFASSFYGPPATTVPATLRPGSRRISSGTRCAQPTGRHRRSPPPPGRNAFINLGAGPYPLASQITTGNAQPWYNSSQISSFFGGQPTAQQQAAFLRCHRSESPADLPAKRRSDHAHHRPHRPGRPHAEPGLEHHQQHDTGRDRHDPDRGQRLQLHRPGSEVGPVARPARMDRRAQHLARADAGLRRRRELRPERQLHRRPEREFRHDGKPHRVVQRRGRPGPAVVEFHQPDNHIWAPRN